MALVNANQLNTEPKTVTVAIEDDSLITAFADKVERTIEEPKTETTSQNTTSSDVARLADEGNTTIEPSASEDNITATNTNDQVENLAQKVDSGETAASSVVAPTLPSKPDYTAYIKEDKFQSQLNATESEPTEYAKSMKKAEVYNEWLKSIDN